uniref:Acetylglutamate kinase n=1 Tax=Cyanidium sp. THAL103 TaxID=3027999 RepID=A0A9Y1I3W2_9RHOD|nr:acetylglutamate kinase [Cyanidium sp. THAL103]
MINDDLRIQILTEALPYMQRFRGLTFVIKYGGAAMSNNTLKESVVKDIIFLSYLGIKIILVHGGGNEINTWLSKLEIVPKFKNGLRVTDKTTMEVVEMVLVGKINKELVSLFNRNGGKAVGLCGKDGSMITTRISKENSIGFVGEIENVNTHLINILISQNYIPIIASVGNDKNGQTCNINADTVAGEIAAALNVEKFLLLTDIPGVLKDINDSKSIIKVLNIKEARSLINDKVIFGGMLPKINCCIRSLAQGVASAHIIDGKISHALLLEIFTHNGIGTMITL